MHKTDSFVSIHSLYCFVASLFVLVHGSVLYQVEIMYAVVAKSPSEKKRESLGDINKNSILRIVCARAIWACAHERRILYSVFSTFNTFLCAYFRCLCVSLLCIETSNSVVVLPICCYCSCLLWVDVNRNDVYMWKRTTYRKWYEVGHCWAAYLTSHLLHYIFHRFLIERTVCTHTWQSWLERARTQATVIVYQLTLSLLCIDFVSLVATFFVVEFDEKE